MTITSSTLTRAAGVAAVTAGLLFIGVQFNHPHLDVTSINTTEVVIRNSLKALMAVLALVGITGMYLSQARRNGLPGLIGYLLLAGGYLLIMSTTLIAASVLPLVAGSDPGFVTDAIALATGGTASGDLGLMHYLNKAQDLGYLLGGLIFGIALYRAHVLARWASALLALGGGVTIALSVMPDAFYRLLALPNGIAMIGLGYSLWSTARPSHDPQTATVSSRPDATAVAA
ncbi:MAG: hypothetical protein WCF36_10265 [Candidatus Nanopelagicales bacterium]